jgi:hypothetical protein
VLISPATSPVEWISRAAIRQVRTCVACEPILEDRRCEPIRLATHRGGIAAICLIIALILAASGTLHGQITVFKYLTATFASAGLILVDRRGEPGGGQ